jgi:protein SCO1/2
MLIQKSKKPFFFIVFVLCFIVVDIQVAFAQIPQNSFVQNELNSMGIEEKLGETISLDAVFALSNGDSVSIQQLLESGKPIILNPVYYECPMLCGLVLNGLLKSTSQLDWSPGREYTIITFSINPNENHLLAETNRLGYLDSLNRNGAENGWYFLTGNNKSIQKLTESIGFNFFYDERIKQYNHPAAIIVLSPDGKIMRYLYGIEYDSIQLKKAMSEAVNGKIGSTTDKLILYCYTYDPNLNSYVPAALNIMKLGGVFIMIGLGTFLGLLWFKEKLKS